MEEHVTPKRKVVVVDDDRTNLMLMEMLFRSFTDCEVLTFTSAVQALTSLVTQDFEVAIVDYMMPEMDGLTATRRIRELESRGGLPRCAILALTAGAFEHEREEMLLGGADDFVAKPFRVATIFEKIGQHLKVSFLYEEPESGASGSAVRSGASPIALRAARLSWMAANSAGVACTRIDVISA